jgi:regulator of sigma E protease
LSELMTPRGLFAFLFVLGVVIFVHELGHLIVARAFNVRVLAFSLGFGKRIWGFKRGETDYRLSLIPLGGYVKLGGEHPEEATSDPRDFVNRPRWQRILVYLAGPAMNVVLAVVLIAVVFMIGIDMEPRKVPPVVGDVEVGSAAEQAGLAMGDRILSLNGVAVSDFQAIKMKVIESPEKPLTIEYERGGERRSTTLTPRREERYGLGEGGLGPPGKVLIRGVLPGQPAQAAGFEPGDQIVKVAGRPVVVLRDFIEYIRAHPGEEVEVEVSRAGGHKVLTVVPQGQMGSAIVGVNTSYSFFQRYPPGQALVESVYYNLGLVRDTFGILGKVLTRRVEAKSALAGPIEIAALSAEVARQGWTRLLHFIGFISISIGIVNVLPIPVLDGGQMLILLVESILRRDLSVVVKERLAQAGVVVIFALMITVIFFDLQKRL